MRSLLAILATILVATVPLSAAELEGVQMPDSADVDGTELVLNGMGLREKFVFDVYVAGLYLESKSSDAAAIVGSDQVKHLRMHFVYKKVAAGKLSTAWTDGVKANSPDQFRQFKPQLEQLNGWMETLVKGDEMTFTSRPGKGLEVHVKGALKGVIEGDQFSRAFWAIFLGDSPPTGPLKKGLLGNG